MKEMDAINQGEDLAPLRKEKRRGDKKRRSEEEVKQQTQEKFQFASQRRAQKLNLMKVERILCHEFNNARRFLTKLEGFDVADSTWESVKAFCGRRVINAEFIDYCAKHGLRQARSRDFTICLEQE